MCSFTFVTGYRYIESSFPHTKGQRALLKIVPVLYHYNCLHFGYSMNGTNIGRLNVYLVVNEKNTKKQLLVWRIAGNQNSGWLQGSVPIRAQFGYTVRLTFLRLYARSGVGELGQLKKTTRGRIRKSS